VQTATKGAGAALGTATATTGEAASTAAGAARDAAAQTLGTATGAGTPAPPIPGFADLPAHAAVAALRVLDDPRDVAATLEFEQAHGNRPAVVMAATLRATTLGG
jgi:hypothetical protein